jgi:dTMP kinase
MFVTIEGLDGSGKSTVLDAITERYPGVVTTSEPSDLEYGQLVRRNLSDESRDPLVDFYLFMADRRDHIRERVKPAEEQGKLVVSDRYADSTRAYQPVALTDTDEFESEWEAKLFIEQTMSYWNYEPDLTLYIDISAETAIERAAGDEKYEQRDFLEEVRENYLALAESTDRIVTIDGEQSKEAVRTAALGKLDIVSPDRL